MTESKPRQCFYIPVGQFDENGYIPSLVTEGEPGHAPLKGSGECAAPWYWGKTYEAAKAFAEEMNAEQFGLTPAQAAEILASSMRAGGDSIWWSPGGTFRDDL
jgi:hypothetical protein